MSKPSMIFVTAERCICLNEACMQHEIRADHTARNIEQKTGKLIVRALCDQCGTFYRATRVLDGLGQWGPPTVEVFATGAEREAFRKRIASVGEIQRKAS